MTIKKLLSMFHQQDNQILFLNRVVEKIASRHETWIESPESKKERVESLETRALRLEGNLIMMTKILNSKGLSPEKFKELANRVQSNSRFILFLTAGLGIGVVSVIFHHLFLRLY